MPNAKFAELVDPRLLEAAFHRYESARALHAARAEKTNADERVNRAWTEHQKTVNDYDTLEADIARGVRMGAGRQGALQAVPT